MLQVTITFQRCARIYGDLPESMPIDANLLLRERRQVLLRVAGNGTRGEDLDRLVDCGELVRAEPLTRLEIVRLLDALSGEVIQIRPIFVLQCSCCTSYVESFSL